MLLYNTRQSESFGQGSSELKMGSIETIISQDMTVRYQTCHSIPLALPRNYVYMFLAYCSSAIPYWSREIALIVKIHVLTERTQLCEKNLYYTESSSFPFSFRIDIHQELLTKHDHHHFVLVVAKNTREENVNELTFSSFATTAASSYSRIVKIKLYS